MFKSDSGDANNTLVPKQSRGHDVAGAPIGS